MKKRNTSEAESSTFEHVGISSKLLNVLNKNGVTTPSPIQHQSIPLALKGKDLIGIAQTGTGKTFAFGLPLLQQLSGTKRRGLIIVPTRELAYQVEESLKPFASALRIQMAVFVGGVPMHNQLRMLKRNPRILIATPGRLNDHLERKSVTLKEVDVLVLDEADRMLDMGFKPQINAILAHVPRKRQTLLFSATMSQDIYAIAKKEMESPLRIEVAPAGTTAEKVEQELIIVRQQDKSQLLQSLLQENTGQVLVFSRTKYGAKKITRALVDASIPAAEIHSNRSLAQRRAALEGFRTGRFRVLVATDIASRGIDVTNITLVINYDLPDDPADYVHRIGRTGRAQREGKAISFATPTQAGSVQEIEKLIRSPLQRKKHQSLPPLELEGKSDSARKKSRGRNFSRRPRRRKS